MTQETLAQHASDGWLVFCPHTIAEESMVRAINARNQPKSLCRSDPDADTPDNNKSL